MALEILKGQVDVNLIGWEDLDKLKRCMRRKTPCKDIGSWRKIRNRRRNPYKLY